MKKCVFICCLFVTFFFFHISVWAMNSHDFSFAIEDGLIADAEDDSESEDSSNGGNHFDASWDNMNPIVPGSADCSTIFKKSDGSFNEFGQFMQDVFTLIKFLAPVLVFAFSTMDYIKAISSQNADELKKANGRFVKRLVAGIAVFLLPFLLDFLFDIFGLYGLDTCGIR